MPSGTSAGGGAALSAPVSVVGKRTGLLLPPSPPTSRPKPQDCESGIGSRTSTLRSVASSSAAAASSPPRTSHLKGPVTAGAVLRKATGGSAHLIAGPGVGRVLGSSGSSGGGGAVACPSCGMPFDKAKKRRLIDACGHERCYSCMFANEACPLCAASTMMASGGKDGGGGRPSPLGAPPGGNIDIVVLPKAKKVSGNSLSASNASIRASETALYGGREGSRPKMKTNGHFTSYMKSRHHQQQPNDAANGESSQWSSSSSWRPPKAHPSINRPPHSSSSSSYSSSSAATHSTAICRHISPDTAAAIRMTQSCPTPPQTRRRFFLSAKSLKNPWRQHHQETAPGAVDPGGGNVEAQVEAKASSPLNALMTASAIAESVTSSLATSLTSSWSSTGTWAEGAIRRIKALWWGGPPTAHNGGPRGSRGGGTVGLNILAREEGPQCRDGGEVEEASSSARQGGGPCRTRGASRTSQSDLHVRLGLLLGDEGSGWSPDTDCQSRVMGGSGYADRETRSPDAGSSSGCRSSLSPPRSCAPLSGGVVPHHRRGPSGCSSLLLSSASLVSLDAPRPPHGGADGGASGSRVIGTSNNTSPASTLTGSSEADVQCRGGRYVVGNRVMPRGLAAAARDRSSDSLASLASLCSSTSPANTTQQQIRRRHSVTTLQPGHVEDLDSFGMRRASIRRSARGGTVADGPTDPKIRFAQFLRRQQQQHDAQCHIPPCQQQQLTLRPLFFEVPLPEWDAPRPLFVGRAWLLESIAVHLKLPPLIPSMYSSQTAGTSINEGTVPLTGTARRSKRQVQSQQTTSASSSGQEIKCPTQCNQNVGNGRGVAIVGGPGTGKTALLLQLVESSCFGRHREPPCRDLHRCGGSGHPGAEEKCCINLVSEKVQALASHVVAYHFCQAENNSTCLVPDFVHSVAAQLCQAPQLVAYRDLLLSNPDLQALLSLPHCIADPDEAIVKGILEPLESIGTPKCDADSLAGSFHQNLSDSYHGESEAMQSNLHGKMQSSYHSSMQGSGQGSQFGDGFCKDMMSSSVGEDSVDRKASCIILVDGLCEAEYHRPDRGPSLGTFLAMHSKRFPPWLKLIVTARTRFADTVLAKDLPYTRISLDDISTDDNLQRDLVDYIHFRASHSPTIRANLSLASPSNTLPSQQQTSPTTSISGMPSAAMAPHGEAAAITRFSQHLLRLSGGSFLFTKLTLDLIERGQLVTKSSSYKVLPLTLAQIFLLHFNLRFHTVRAFERVLPILSVVLASLSPPTLLEVFYSVNALRVERFLSWDEFITRFKTLSGFIVKRLDDTYMFFHPAFREWLIRREEGDSTKFLCDPRIGHLGVALRLTRLQCPLEGEALLELGHHILKAHPHRGLTLRWPLCSRDLQATWVAGAAADASRSLATLRNSYAPNVKVSRLLLLAGASPNARLDATPGDPLLSVAAQRGDTEVVSLLLEFGADAGAESSVGCTALSLAASAGHEGVVAALLNARGPAAGAGRMDREGRCPLVLASLGGHMGVVALLLSSDWVVSGSGREVSLEEASVQSLVAAAMQGHTELVEYLLDMCNVSPDVVDRLTGETALTASVSYGRHSTAAALLMRGASVTVPNSKGLPPLVAAVSGGGCATVRRQGTVCSVVELLLQVGGASPEQRDSSGRTALAHAAADGNVTLVRLLLEKGTSVHLEDKEGLSALGWACLKGQVATARVLLDAGAQVQRADASGRTPLHLAAAAPSASQQSSTPLVQLLLERGAVLEGVDAMGLRPLDRAVGTRNISGVHCFLRRGARLGPATWAMAAGKPDVTLILLNKLLEDGNVLYKKGRLQEASHRYRYALKKCPSEEETVACAGVEGGWAMDDEEDSPAKLRELFDSVRVHLMLNLSRCTRKLGEYSEAVELAEGVLRLRPDSYEAHYARAKAKVDLGDVDGALQDIEEALRVVPSGNREARRVLRRVQEELQAEVCPKVSTAKREPCLGEDERVTEE